MSAPTKEQIDCEVAQCRAMEVIFPVSIPDHMAVVVALADENDRLRAERDEVVLALEEMKRMPWIDDVADACDALIAKVRTP